MVAAIRVKSPFSQSALFGLFVVVIAFPYRLVGWRLDTFSLDRLSRVLLNSEYGRQRRPPKAGALRVDRGDGQGLRQPAPPRAAGPPRAGTADRRSAREGEQAVGGECFPAPPRPPRGGPR